MSDKGRILVVDDNEATRYSVVRVLRSDGHTVLEAGTGAQGLELARGEHPDLLVLDVRLPDVLGFEVARQLKEDPQTRSIGILHLSASFTGADAQAEGLKNGADGYLTHPVEPQVLTATIRALLRLRRAEQREKEARERAEASEAQHRFLAEMVPQLVWSNDAGGRLDYFNQRWLDFTGLTLEQAQRGGWLESIHPEDRDRIAAAWAHAIAHGAPYQIEARQGRVGTGHYRWMLIRAQAQRDSAGTIVRWFGTCTDIDEQKQAMAERERLLADLRRTAEERERLVERLRAEDRRKNEFIAVLSHELRNPLAPIRNSVYILERAVPGGEQSRRARQVIDRQVRHMERLVEDLLDVTRITRGKIRLQPERVELSALVRGVGEDLREAFSKRQVTLDITVDAEPALFVNGDPTRLAQITGNLLQNAAKFTPSGGHTVLSLRRDGDQAVIEVADSGAGIAPEVLTDLFEPFVQADRTLDRSSGGLGLGLSLVKGLAELHGGSVIAHSDGPGKGARFTVRIPLEVAAMNAAKGRLVAVAPVAAARRVLIVEDSRDTAGSLREVLELLDHHVEVAYTGPEGLEKARAFLPDVVLCDIGLPGLDGYGVARALRADPELSGACLIALSGYASVEDAERSREAGFDYHLAKPPELAALERLLTTAPLRASSRDSDSARPAPVPA